MGRRLQLWRVGASLILASSVGWLASGETATGTEPPAGVAPAKANSAKPSESEAKDEPATKEAAATEGANSESASSGSALSDKLKQIAGRVSKEQTFTLRYRFEPGESVRWRVVQLVTVDTRIRGREEVAKTRSVSTKLWKVSHVDDAGNMTFVQQIEDADMWQSVSGGAEVKYNSRQDKVAPREYEHVAKSIGIPLTKITLSPTGRVVKREDVQALFSPGLSDLAIPLPEGPVRLGAKWHMPDEVRLRMEDGRFQRIVTRQVYTLDKVETGVATIGVRTEVLTPVTDPKIQSQLVRRLLNGHLKFDLDAGRLIGKQLDLDETVIGFSGVESVMQYLARTTEELLATPAGARAVTRRD